MAWIDIAILAIVVLFGVMGVLRGVKKSMLSLCTFLVAFVLSFFLANVVAEALMGIGGVQNFVVGKGDYGSEGASFSLAKMVYDGLGENRAGLSLEESLLGVNFFKPIEEIVGGSSVITGNTGVAIYIAFLIFSTICGVGIFIVVRFLFMIVTAIIKSYIGKKKSIASRLFGFLVSGVYGGVVAFVATFIFSCFGGLVFVDAIAAVESEFEQDTAVVCPYVYKAAYIVRNKLFLPNEGMYGRIATIVADAGYVPEPVKPELEGERLNMFINVSNLNYSNDPWSIELQRRKFDEENAHPYSASEFAKVNFDAVFQSILDYNTQAAANIDDREKFTDLTNKNWQTYNDMIVNNTTNVNKAIEELVMKLREYIADYDKGNKLESAELTLKSDYGEVIVKLNALKTLYGDLAGIYGEMPDLTPPDCVKPKEDEDPPTPPDPDKEKLSGNRLTAFIAASNLNYENSPWSVDDETGKRAFDSENAKAYNATEFASVGFDTTVKAILDHNAQAVQSIDDIEKYSDFDNEKWLTFGAIISANKDNLTKATTEFIEALRNYISDYDKSATLENAQDKLTEDYTAVTQKLDALKTLYGSAAEVFGAVPELTPPECVTPKENEDPPTPPEPDDEKLSGKRLEAFIAASNLNYENSPWSIDPDTNGRKFDGESAKAYAATEFAAVGFDTTVKTILDRNAAIAADIDDLTKSDALTDEEWESLKTKIAAVKSAVDDLLTALKQYASDYENSATLENAQDKLTEDYNAVTQKLDALKTLYAELEEAFGVTPELTPPECMTPKAPVVPENPEEQGEVVE